MEKEIFYLILEDMTANAFIELNKRSKQKITEISIDIIENYGNKTAEKLKEKGKKVCFGLSRNNTEYFRRRYNELFSLKDNENNPGSYSHIILNDGIEVEDLIKKFRGHLPLDLLLAYIDNDVVEKGLLEPLSLSKNNYRYKTPIKVLNIELNQREKMLKQEQIEKQIKHLEKNEIVKEYFLLLEQLRSLTTQMEENNRIINYLNDDACNHDGILLSLDNEDLYECICLDCGKIISVDLKENNPFDIIKLDLDYEDIIKLAPQIIENYQSLSKENNDELDIIKELSKKYVKN